MQKRGTRVRQLENHSQEAHLFDLLQLQLQGAIEPAQQRRLSNEHIVRHDAACRHSGRVDCCQLKNRAEIKMRLVVVEVKCLFSPWKFQKYAVFQRGAVVVVQLLNGPQLERGAPPHLKFRRSPRAFGCRSYSLSLHGSSS